MAGIVLKVVGVRELQHRLMQAASNLDDMRKPLQQFGNKYRERMRRRFETEGFGTWAPLAPSTVAEKAAAGFAGKTILRRTDRLFRSLAARREGAESIQKIGRRWEWRIGTDVPYAKFHQEGTRNMPARPFLVFDKEDEHAAEVVMQAFVAGAIRKAGLK